MLADRIREFCYKHFILPASKAGKTDCWIRAGDVHQRMGLQNRMPAVCAALQSKAFRDGYDLSLDRREGPPQGSNAQFYFRIAPENPGEISAGQVPTLEPVPIPANMSTDVPPRTICLVSCVSRKKVGPAQAADIYDSEWFRRARHFVETLKCPWFILSAKYGLVEPDRVITAYDETLNTMSVAERRAWALRVQSDMDAILPPTDCIIVLAGMRYREFLMDYLQKRARDVRVPLEGLRIGEQVSQLGKRGQP